MKRILIMVLAAILFLPKTFADEGMWPISMIAKLEDKMQARGLKLTAEDIYSINKACVKDAVVGLMRKGSTGGRFCTGEIISKEGLFLTNHHCGYGAIQELSTPADNILSNGFFATSRDKERPANFNISILKKIEEVTADVLKDIDATLPEADRIKAVNAAISKLEMEFKNKMGEEKDNYIVTITSFYNGNKYLAMYYEIYRDIRLVGTPPENVGKFGGETDNWRWPRHTCDFSMFRIYVNDKNKPADYNQSNVPYKPAYHFPVSLKGYKEGDYSMILGYPGRTTRYYYSEGIKYLGNKERPMRVQVRRDIMDVYEFYMKKDKNIRLMYSDKLASIGNYWNKFNGEAKDLTRSNLYDVRKKIELDFEKWVRNSGKQAIYGDVMSMYDDGYKILNQYGLYSVYLQDGISNSQVLTGAFGVMGMVDVLDGKFDATKYKDKPEELKKAKEEAKTKKENLIKKLKAGVGEVGKNFSEFYDKIEVRVLEAVIRRLLEDLDHAHLPATLVKMNVKMKKNYAAMAQTIFENSMFSDSNKLKKFYKSPSSSKIKSDLAYKIVSEYLKIIGVDLKPKIDEATYKLNRANRLFFQGLMEKEPNTFFAPDANSTMRLTYGQVLSYKPRDGVNNYNFTTAKGIVEKYIPSDFEFDAPVELINLINSKNYGKYADADGELHTCFLSDNDITGGNSGSPVLNANGELIGTAFDGNYEAISSDFMFMPDLQRTISVDIRYTLFIVDKLGKASNIIDELTIR